MEWGPSESRASVCLIFIVCILPKPNSNWLWKVMWHRIIETLICLQSSHWLNLMTSRPNTLTSLFTSVSASTASTQSTRTPEVCFDNTQTAKGLASWLGKVIVWQNPVSYVLSWSWQSIQMSPYGIPFNSLLKMLWYFSGAIHKSRDQSIAVGLLWSSFWKLLHGLINDSAFCDWNIILFTQLYIILYYYID